VRTDYLVVGAGTAGLSFVDSLLDADPTADVVLVDRRPGPGGHWLEGYPFLRLHLPTALYGVESTALGSCRVQTHGTEVGLYERASGAEVCAYFDRVVRERFVASGRVRYLPMTEALNDGRVRSLVTGALTTVETSRAVVDATRNGSEVPESFPPPFEIGEGVRWVTPTGLTRLEGRPDGFVVIGSGKTGMDTCVWLLEQGVAPDDIRWVRPRDGWMLQRRFFQVEDLSLLAMEGTVLTLEALAAASELGDAYERLERDGVTVRLDPEVRPTMCRAASLSDYEVALLRQIRQVIRLGHVRRITSDRIVLDHGDVPTGPGVVHVHCAAPGLPHEPASPVFADGRVTLGIVTRVSISLSAAMIARVQAEDLPLDVKNRLCPTPLHLDGLAGYFAMVLSGLGAEFAWREHPGLRSWLEGARLNTLRRDRQRGVGDEVRELGRRIGGCVAAAAANLARIAQLP
jgi:hypothetical protein